MNRLILYISILFLFACELPGKKTRALISVEELSNLLLKSRVQIIDVRHPDQYLSGHIPGAANIWINEIQDNDQRLSGDRISKYDFETILRESGLNARDSIFLYDDIGNLHAAQIWWLLKFYGFDKVALIDGGLISWQLSQKNVRSGYENIQSRTFVFSRDSDRTLLAHKQNILDKTYDQIIDCRTQEEYNGEVMKNGSFRAGHIPNAILLDQTELIRANDFQIKSVESIRKIFKKKGLNPVKSTLIYGHHALHSSLSVFVLTEIMEMETVYVYEGSWMEWSEDESLPITKK